VQHGASQSCRYNLELPWGSSAYDAASDDGKAATGPHSLQLRRASRVGRLLSATQIRPRAHRGDRWLGRPPAGEAARLVLCACPLGGRAGRVLAVEAVP
jgi:hypothetical protein